MVGIFKCLSAFFTVLFFVLLAFFVTSLLPVSESWAMVLGDDYNLDYTAYITLSILGCLLCLEGRSICLLKMKYRNIFKGD